MEDPNWELINGPAAHEIEYINLTNQVNVIEAMTILYNTVVGMQDGYCRAPPNIGILQELHRCGTLFLLQRPGAFRDQYNVSVFRADGSVVYQPPPWEEVGAYMNAFFQELDGRWHKDDPLLIAAFVLWRLNWVHPFKNGNGRTARAFAYACLCLKIGVFLPGKPTVIDQIVDAKPAYEAALRAADASYATTGQPDLTPMTDYLAILFERQIAGMAASTNPDAGAAGGEA